MLTPGGEHVAREFQTRQDVVPLEIGELSKKFIHGITASR